MSSFTSFGFSCMGTVYNFLNNLNRFYLFFNWKTISPDGHARESCSHGDVSAINLSVSTPKPSCYCFICPLCLKYSLLL